MQAPGLRQTGELESIESWLSTETSAKGVAEAQSFTKRALDAVVVIITWIWLYYSII